MDDTFRQDHFDRLPDDVVLSIFDRLQDAKSLCSSMSVCKRFHTIAPQVVDIYIPVPLKKPPVDQETHKNSSFKNLLLKTLMKPFNLISQLIRFKSKNDENDLDLFSYSVPNQILKSFQRIRALHLKLPCHVTQSSKAVRVCKNSTTLLRWRAEFGRELQSCVILGARSWSEQTIENKDDNQDGRESRLLTDDELKLRIVWTISCLIAASARHYLVHETVKEMRAIENVVVSDESGQGRVCMNRGQIEEMMEGQKNGGWEYSSSRGGRMPALRMKMWYLERVEVAGKVMEGATLVVVRPAADGKGVGEVAFGEDGVLDEAVRKLMVAKKCYTLEMNSF